MGRGMGRGMAMRRLTRRYGFFIRCRVRDLPAVLAAIRKKYGERVIRWGWEMDRKNREA